MLKRSIIGLFLLFALFLCACSNTLQFDAGTPITPEEIAMRKAELQEETKGDEGADKGGEESTPESQTPDNGVVFWLKNGTVYHVSQTCYHIKEKQGVLVGTVDEALAAGKLRACSSCGKD